MEQQIIVKKADNNPADTSIEQVITEKADNPVEASMKQEITANKADNAEASGKSVESGKKTTKSLKPKSKIKKKIPTSTLLQTKKGNGAMQDHENNRNNKKNIVLMGKKESSKTEEVDAQKTNSREEKQKKHVKDEMHNRNSQQNGTHEKVGGLEKKQEIWNNKEKPGGSDKNLKGRKNSETRDGLENSWKNREKKEKLGGLIFMCSAKTKPDCFRYRVMGVPMSKKDIVLGAKPGLKLFLYDFDLKLLYGIYKACSSGGMKLEPKAFGGAFPVQVRFNIQEDCYPLPDIVFKKAISENFISRNKFKTELTVPQARKLSELFRPAKIHGLPRTPPTAAIQDREVHHGIRESRPHLRRETSTGDRYANADGRSYPILSRERDEHIAFREGADVWREEIPHESYPGGKDYRVYDLQGERRNLKPLHPLAPALDPYPREREREQILRHPDIIHRDTIPALREPVHTDPLYLNEREYRLYGLGARPEVMSVAAPAPATTSTATMLDSYSNDPYNTYHYTASYADPYLPPPRRDANSSGSYSLGLRSEAYLTQTDQLQREADQVERLYASNALLEYNPRPRYEEARHEPVRAPVSSRYTFGGPSMSYR